MPPSGNVIDRSDNWISLSATTENAFVRLAEQMSLLDQYVAHASAHGYALELDTQRRMAQVLMPETLGRGIWTVCELLMGDLVQYVVVRSRRRHTHRLLEGEYFAIHLMLRGRFDFTTRSDEPARRIVGPAAIAVFTTDPQNISFEIRPGWVEMLSFYFTAQRIEALQRLAPYIAQYLQLRRSVPREASLAHADIIPIDVSIFSNFGKSFTELSDLAMSTSERFRLEVIGAQLLNSFCRFAELAVADPSSNSADVSSRIAAIANDLARNAPNGVARTGEAAKALGMSAAKFKKAYKEHTGVTYKTFRENVRHGRANSLLQNSNLTIEQISTMLGFQHVSSFCRSYKRRTGLTPTAARRLSVVR